jgi:hypothetical protein
MLLMATALSRSFLGTMDASIPWKAGKLSAPRTPPTNARVPITGTVSESVAERMASDTGTSMLVPWKARRSLRWSYRSASAPPGRARTRFGIVLRNPITPSVAADPPTSKTT